MTARLRDLIALSIAIVACQAAGVAGSRLTRPSIADGWYGSLAKPALTPPPLAFAIVWPTLFLLMGIAAFRVWKRCDRDAAVRPALALFTLHLLVNVAWSAVFFAAKSPWGGLAVIALLATTIAVLIVRFGRIDRIAAWLLVPYAFWVAFAIYLNASIAWANYATL
ncbi:TspO/MBR family protein [Marinivivus vitaminiproducens]|uniref:TspO/MBR family protein n=1 Tax=Marinivivus vitaminiproducens TaxID=3035935 RepID=UPI0027A8E20D|nr:tryptophan-rich sensory protein [Geminicoccaceae bacterium SCSIO 64248]